MRGGSRLLATLATAALLAGTAGCGSDSSNESDKDPGEQFSSVADQSTCLADATAAATPWPDGFPGDWPFPAKSTAYNVEDRGTDGIIVTAVTGSAFKDVLEFMNKDVADAGYEVESGETEAHDAEAEWTGNGYRGRWAIRESAQCPGETVIQVLSTH
ncbi:hypothetical protein [Nocardioides sp. LS1]|uniref:hypothetical protein n=1 Tax=Nocardioides sp. LS1 TaxID=1027620 RepID=UPI000F620D0C|nr:hypothetical protein [Nocardioides sp. LS1]GCD90837.1 hypothetical protein NLS1_28430 [Nocardioides sp. LS1]